MELHKAIEEPILELNLFEDVQPLALWWEKISGLGEPSPQSKVKLSEELSRKSPREALRGGRLF